MNLASKLGGAAAVIMAVCCAVLPLVGAALGGGLIAGAGTVGMVAGALVLIAVVVALARRRRTGAGCGC